MSDVPNNKSDVRIAHYEVHIHGEDLEKKFTDEEKILLRPIAETLAMLDGNAFFTIDAGDGEWYEQYLPDAYSVFKANGGMNGWACEVSWIKEKNLSNPAVQEAWNNFLTVSKLSKESK